MAMSLNEETSKRPENEPRNPLPISSEILISPDGTLQITPGTASPEQSFEGIFNEGMQYLRQGNLFQAADCYRAAIAINSNHAGAWHYLGVVFLSQRNLSESLRCIERSLEFRTDRPEYYNNYGVVLRELGRGEEAFRQFSKAVEMRPTYADAWSNLGLVHLETGHLTEAETLLQKALSLNANHTDALICMGELLARTGRFENLVDIFSHTFQDFSGAIRKLAQKLNERAFYKEVDELYRYVCIRFPEDSFLFSDRIGLLIHQERIEEAIPLMKIQSRSEPENSLGKYCHLGLCPVIFQDTESIEHYWHELHDLLDELLGSNILFDWKTLPYKGFIPSFHLSHHGKSCKDIRSKFGRLFARMFPHEKPRRQRGGNGRIRIGFLVCHGHEPGFCRVWSGIIERLDRSRFEPVVLAMPQGIDYCRNKITSGDIVYVPLSEPFEKAVETIRELGCEIIMHRKVGSDPWSYFLPFAQLAPVQVTSYGTHGTSGVSAVDYFLTSRFVEPENAYEYYSEKPYLLNSLPAYEKLTEKPKDSNRNEFGLPEQGAIYLCPHRPLKYHPDFDPYLREILERDQIGHIVLLTGKKSHPLECLKSRFTRTIGIKLMSRMIFMPSIHVDRYYRLLSLATMVLDSSVYAGGLSSFDAFGLGVPEVTQSGPLHVQNYATGIYRRMEMPEMPVYSREGYVDLAVRLGTEPDYHKEVSSRIEERKHLIFERKDDIPLWEQFFEEILTGI